MIAMIARGCSALIAPSQHYARTQRHVGTNVVLMSTSANIEGKSSLLDPNVVSSKVFDSDRRPVILFDGGT